MKNFPSFFLLEVKRFFCKRNIVVLLIFLAIALYFVQDGIHQYKRILENEANFKKIERIKVNQYSYYNQYGSFGFRLLFVPSPISAYFVNSGAFSELVSHIDAGEILRIYDSFKGRALFTEKARGGKDFAGILLLFGSLFVLWFGYETFTRKEYIRFLSGFTDYKVIYRNFILSKVVMVSLFSLIVVLIPLILFKLNNISLKDKEVNHIFAFMVVLIFMMIFFLMIGIILGTLKSKFNALVSLILVWFCFVFLFPGIISKVTAEKAENVTSSYKLETEKLKLLMEFEKRAIAYKGKLQLFEKVSGEEKKLIEDFWSNEYKAIQELEDQMTNEMVENIRFQKSISLFSPSSFYLSVNNEISSRGYDNVIAFYEYIKKLKNEFTRFYFNKLFSHKENENIESFVKSNENIFTAQSRLPANFWKGLGISSIYIIVLFFLSFIRIKRYLFDPFGPGEMSCDSLTIKLDKGKCTVCITSSDSLRMYLYNFFAGFITHFPGNIELDNENISEKVGGLDFTYLCHPDFLPQDVQVRDLLMLLRRVMKVTLNDFAEVLKKYKLDLDHLGKKSFSQLNEVEKGNFLFAAARFKKNRVYLINEVERGMAQSFTNGLMENLRKLKKEGEVAVLYFSSNLYFTAKVSERMVVPGGERIENILK